MPRIQGAKPTPAQQLRWMLQARMHLVWIATGEERRVEREVSAVARQLGCETVLWSCASGLSDARTGEQLADAIDTVNPAVIFDKIKAGHTVRRKKTGDDGKPQLDPISGEVAEEDVAVPTVWVLRDLDDWLGEPVLRRALKDLTRDLQDRMGEEKKVIASHWQWIVVLSQSSDVPAGLRSWVNTLEWPLPTREELGLVLDRFRAYKALGEKPALIDAAAGLAVDDAADAFAYSIASVKAIDPAVVTGRKKAIIDRSGVLTWFDADPRGLDALGGLDLLKTWLSERALALTPEAREYGLPAPKGVFLTGPPGNGKSLTAKAVAAAWGGLPLLRMDMGALKGGIVGQSEQRIRGALRTAEAVAPCVLWIDEIEKGLAGSMGYSGDSGVSADQLGTLLTWLQEHEGAVFVVATSNDPIKLPPELTRKGRFDEIFFVDLPGKTDRASILLASLNRVAKPSLGAKGGAFSELHPECALVVAENTAGFSGAEIAELVPTAMFRAFADGKRPLRTEDLLQAARETVPVSKSRAGEVAALRAWARDRARKASAAETVQAAEISQPRPVSETRALGIAAEA